MTLSLTKLLMSLMTLRVFNRPSALLSGCFFWDHSWLSLPHFFTDMSANPPAEQPRVCEPEPRRDTWSITGNCGDGSRLASGAGSAKTCCCQKRPAAEKRQFAQTFTVQLCSKSWSPELWKTHGNAAVKHAARAIRGERSCNLKHLSVTKHAV